MKRKPPALRSIGIDPSRRSIDTFRCDYPVEPHHGCALRFPETFAFQGREPVYRDPPYVQSTRRSQRRHRFDCTDDEHVALLGILTSLPCQVTVSGYPSRLHHTHLAGWRPVGIQVNNQACVVTGKLWFNFVPGRPHWHTCAGRNSIDRQRIKRLTGSWARRCRAMPGGERLAVPAAVMAVEAL